MPEPLVTIGLPFYNSHDCLFDAIRSIFAQTYQNWELILVDDCSKDHSTDIVVSIKDPRVKFIPPDGLNLRLAARLNQITSLANGRYIARMDADDMSHPQRLQKQIDFLENNPDIDVVGTNACILDTPTGTPVKTNVASSHQEIFAHKFDAISIVHPSITAKAQWFRRFPYNEKMVLSQDNELWLRSCSQSVFANIDELLYLKNEFSSFKFRKYAKAKHLLAQATWELGRAEIGTLKSATKTLIHYLHVGVYLSATLLCQADKLIERRYKDLTDKEKTEFFKSLEIIKNTKIPLESAPAQ